MPLYNSVQIVAKLTPEGVDQAFNFLGPDGRNYVLYYKVPGSSTWTPIPLVENFPH